jgi:SGNH domain (fused to AT3 domains)
VENRRHHEKRVRPDPNRGHSSCIQWNKDVDDVLLRLHPDVVFTTSTRRRRSADTWAEYVPEAYLEYWSRWEKSNITVMAVRDSPKVRKDAFECIEKNPSDLKKCSLPRRKLFNEIDPTSRLDPKPTNVSFIDLTDRFCDRELCSPVGGNVLVYRDTHHITIEYSRTLATPLGERMKQVRPDLFLMETQANSPKHQRADAGERLDGPAVKER